MHYVVLLQGSIGTKTCFIRRTLVASNVIQTKVNKLINLINCLNCIRHTKSSTFKPGLTPVNLQVTRIVW